MRKALIILLFLVIGGGAIAYFMYNKPHKSVEGESAAYSVSAAELFEEFASDEQGANQKYLEKIVLVHGELINTDFKNEAAPSLLLATSDGFGTILCEFPAHAKPQLEQLPSKAKVNIKGFVKGFTDIDVLLKDCMIVEE